MRSGLNVILLLATILGLVTFCQTKPKSSEESVSFFDREIDLSPYFSDFPYSDFHPFLDAEKVFYFHDGAKKTLKMVSFDQAKEGQFDQGEKLSSIDFSKANFWAPKYNKKDNSLYWVGDEDNTEITNIYKMNLNDRKIKKLTKFRYIYGYRFNEKKNKIAYVARVKDGVQAHSEVHVLDLKTMESRKIAADGGKLRYYWGTPSWSSDGKYIIVSAIENNDRSQKQLLLYNTKTGRQKRLLNQKIARSKAEPLKNWFDKKRFFYIADDDGIANLYLKNIETGQSQKLTHLDTNVEKAQYLKGNLVFISQTPIRSTLYVFSKTKKSMKFRKSFEKKMEGLFSLKDSDPAGNLLLSKSAYDTKVKFYKTKLASNSIKEMNVVLAMDQNLLDRMIHTEKIEDLEYETFDIDPKTKKKRKIKALLYHPKKPLKGKRNAAMVQSFYGYWNRYRDVIQILQQAGLYVLTPAPRGAGGLGREFAALNDKDLGGSEILDVIYGGKFLEKKLEIESKKIGVFGRSHGGYATMRLMTFPGKVNGHKADFPWGFGVASAGFSDIAHFYKNTNIPTWVLLEAGDPEKEKEKLRSRSPLYNPQHFRGRLLIIHGSNDRRVPVEGSRQMAKALEKVAPKKVTYVEWPNQGHSVKGLQNNLKKFRVWFEFLESSITAEDQ